MGDPSHRDNIQAQLGGFFDSHTTQGAVTGGSFAYSEADLGIIIKNWKDLADSYRRSMRNAEYMSRIEPPAEDFASKWHAVAANRSGESYQQYLEHNYNYCAQQAELSQIALDKYLGVEHTNVTEMNKPAPQGPQPGV
jgi:hypothetical protein